MKLGQLMPGMSAEACDLEITEIAIHSAHVTTGSLFIAIDGVARDGHDYLPEAVNRGAAALVVEQPNRVPQHYAGPVLVVHNGRAALNQAAARFYGDPGRDLFCVAITGTDGKSTVAWMVEAVLGAGGRPTGVIGTVDHHFGAHVWPGATTPPPLALQERLRVFVDLGAEAVALEATSQGLSQSRIGSVPLDVAVFTNLTRDHLDYHGSIEGYFAAKARLFTETLAASDKPSPHAVINVDTPFGARIGVPPRATTITYGCRGTGANLSFELRHASLTETVFSLHGHGQNVELSLPMLGAFNGANALAAIATGMASGMDFTSAAHAMQTFNGVPGRVQRVGSNRGPLTFVDYAHDPHAFDVLLPHVKKAMAQERAQGRLVTVFGCGGDRDRGKRPLMLKAALRWSDAVYITSDNPRSEDPGAIAHEILAGLNGPDDEARVQVVLDRREAIASALASAGPQDVVMVLGKGHEPYQVVGTERMPYSDQATIEELVGG